MPVAAAIYTLASGPWRCSPPKPVTPWLLDPKDHLAARLSRDGDPEDLYFEETGVSFAIGWKGNYRIEGNAFVYLDKDSGRIVTILGYPTRRIAEWVDREISNMFGWI